MMAYYDSSQNKIVRFDSYPCKEYPGWDITDCGCCAGIQWGGEYPRECEDCGATGRYFRHRKSGVTALYPGGPFTGSEP